MVWSGSDLDRCPEGTARTADLDALLWQLAERVRAERLRGARFRLRRRPGQDHAARPEDRAAFLPET